MGLWPPQLGFRSSDSSSILSSVFTAFLWLLRVDCLKASLYTREARGVTLGEARGLFLRGVGTKRFSREQGKREVTGVFPEDTSLW